MKFSVEFVALLAFTSFSAVLAAPTPVEAEAVAERNAEAEPEPEPEPGYGSYGKYGAYGKYADYGTYAPPPPPPPPASYGKYASYGSYKRGPGKHIFRASQNDAYSSLQKQATEFHVCSWDAETH